MQDATQRTACPGAPEASINAGGSGGSAVRLHRARSWGLGLVLLSLLMCIDSIFKPSCQTGTPLCPRFTDKETEMERALPQVGGVEPGFVQAGWSPFCAPTTGHVIPSPS